jgi:hypothetical protein
MTDKIRSFFVGGEEGIRTLDEVAPIPPFQGGALDQLCDLSVQLLFYQRITPDFFTTYFNCRSYLVRRTLKSTGSFLALVSLNTKTTVGQIRGKIIFILLKVVLFN